MSRDRSGTVNARVFVEGTDVNHLLVRDGHAWWFEKAVPHDDVLQRLQAEARNAKKGLWQASDPTPPWKWSEGKQ